jgi:hypothetical protein
MLDNKPDHERGDVVIAIDGAIWPKNGGNSVDAIRPEGELIVMSVEHDEHGGGWYTRLAFDNREFPSYCFSKVRRCSQPELLFLERGCRLELRNGLMTIVCQDLDRVLIADSLQDINCVMA